LSYAPCNCESCNLCFDSSVSSALGGRFYVFPRIAVSQTERSRPAARIATGGRQGSWVAWVVENNQFLVRLTDLVSQRLRFC